MINLLSKYRYWIFISLIFIFLRLPSFFEPYWYGDEGIYLTIGQAIRKGLVLYQQIHDNKPPTLYFLAALGQTVFGFRLLLFLIMIPTIYLFYRLSLLYLKPLQTKIATLIFVVLTSIPLIEGNIANAEIFMLLPTILGFIIFLKAKKNIYYLLSGLFLGLAFTIKIPVFIELFLLIIWVFFSDFDKTKKHFWSQLSKIFILGIGFIIPIFTYLIYFSFIGVLLPFLNSALLQNFSYLSSWATDIQTASASSGGLISRLIILIIYWILVLILKYKKIISTNIAFLLAWLAATVFGSLLSTRPYPHYLIQLLPVLCLILPSIFLKKKYQSLIIFISLFLTCLIIIKYKFYFYSNISYYSNFYLSHSTNSYYKYFGNEVENNYQIADFIKNNSNKNDHIFIWGDQPYIYALTDRLPPGRYTVAYHIVDFNGYEETINSFKIKMPKFIIYYPMTNRSYNNLDDFIQRYYFLHKVFNSVLIYQKR